MGRAEPRVLPHAHGTLERNVGVVPTSWVIGSGRAHGAPRRRSGAAPDGGARTSASRPNERAKRVAHSSLTPGTSTTAPPFASRFTTRHWPGRASARPRREARAAAGPGCPAPRRRGGRAPARRRWGARSASRRPRTRGCGRGGTGAPCRGPRRGPTGTSGRAAARACRDDHPLALLAARGGEVADAQRAPGGDGLLDAAEQRVRARAATRRRSGRAARRRWRAGPGNGVAERARPRARSPPLPAPGPPPPGPPPTLRESREGEKLWWSATWTRSPSTYRSRKSSARTAGIPPRAEWRPSRIASRARRTASQDPHRHARVAHRVGDEEEDPAQPVARVGLGGDLAGHATLRGQRGEHLPGLLAQRAGAPGSRRDRPARARGGAAPPRSGLHLHHRAAVGFLPGGPRAEGVPLLGAGRPLEPHPAADRRVDAELPGLAGGQLGSENPSRTSKSGVRGAAGSPRRRRCVRGGSCGCPGAGGRSRPGTRPRRAGRGRRGRRRARSGPGAPPGVDEVHPLRPATADREHLHRATTRPGHPPRRRRPKLERRHRRHLRRARRAGREGELVHGVGEIARVREDALRPGPPNRPGRGAPGPRGGASDPGGRSPPCRQGSRPRGPRRLPPSGPGCRARAARPCPARTCGWRPRLPP